MLVLLISPFLVKHYLEQRRLRAAIQRHFDAIRAAGLPVTGRELQALRPNPPPERDWRMVVEPLLIANELQVEAWELWHTNAPFDLVLPAIQRDLASNTQVLAVILQMDLSGLESRVDWPADPDEVFGRKFERFSTRLRLAEALGGQGVYEASTGHPERATAALVNSFAAARAGDLCLVSFAIQQSQKIAVAVESMAKSLHQFPSLAPEPPQRVLPARCRGLAEAAFEPGELKWMTPREFTEPDGADALRCHGRLQ